MDQEPQPNEHITGNRLLKTLGLDSNKWTIGDRRIALLGIGIGLTIVIIAVCGYVFGWDWTGLTKPQRTFWDWLSLLIVPIVLALGGYLFNRSENRRTREDAEQRAQHETLQAYFNHIGELLLLDKDRSLRRSEEGDEVRNLARARTLTTLARLDGESKGRVVQFLFESRLIVGHGPPDVAGIIDLSGADLTKADLTMLDLAKLDLASAETMGINLNRADLSGSTLKGATLKAARLGETNLSGANLEEANLSIAHLWKTDLSGANLRGAQGEIDGKPLTGEHLGHAKSLKGATMPDGKQYEDWLGTYEGQEWLREYKSNLGWQKKNVDGDYEAWIETTEGKMWLRAVSEYEEDSGPS